MPRSRPTWPQEAPFCLFLSHDVDQVHDRGVYRTLGDLNRFRRVLMKRASGNSRACANRVFRSTVWPKDWRPQFERILEIESCHGWKSTFYFLEGHRWSRYGSRYELQDPRIRALAKRLLEAGCEIGVHGGYHDFNNAERYRRSADRIERAFGVRPVGIRNHYLRFSFPETWLAQATAGYLYDATFGRNNQVGFRDGHRFPFEPLDPATGNGMGILVLPLTVMDVTLFQYLRLSAADAVSVIDGILRDTATSGGLVSVLWHNTYFDEPEYAEWEEVYTECLRRAATYRPYCATGMEIAKWWNERRTYTR